MPNLKPFRDYDEHDVINLFAIADQSDVNKGTLVKVSTGWVRTDEPFGIDDVVGSSSYVGKAVSDRYSVTAKVDIAGSGDAALGMTLYDLKEDDENGEKLKFNPRKAAEMQVAISGQAMPVATRGLFVYSGATLAGETPDANSGLYCAANGELSTHIDVQIKAGSALGGKDSQNYVLVLLDCDPTRKVDGSN
jgi:hypothetical protein